jgi:hypothetical protein
VIAALLRALRGGPAGVLPGTDDDDSPAFVSGLALGALVGAAIAGSALWRRFHPARLDPPSGPDPRIETNVPE